METKNRQWRRVLICIIVLVTTSIANAQVMYNLRGGIMPVTIHDDMPNNEESTTGKIDWMIEFGLEIPISKNWNIETSLRYRSKSFIAYKDYDFGSYLYNEDYLAKHPDEDFNKRLYRTYSNASLMELPIRATYKLLLSDNFALHIGCGPYASFNLTGKPFDAGMPFESSALSVGIEPSVALYYKNLSLGVIYNNPIIFQRHDEMDSNRFMITLGFRFGNKVWRSIGHGIEKAADSGALDIIANTANQVAENIGEYNRAKQELMENSYSTQENKTSKTKSSSSSSKNKYSISGQQSYKSAKDAYQVLDDMVRKWRFGGRTYTEQEKKDTGKRMRDLRMGWVNKGYNDWPHDNEDWCFQ